MKAIFKWLTTPLLAMACVASPAWSQADRADTVQIYTAASMAMALKDAARHLTDNRLSLFAADSATLARQIARGSPADVFISTNPGWIRFLKQQPGFTQAQTRVIASNRLVWVAPLDRRMNEIRANDIETLEKALDGGRFALADMKDDIAGRTGQEALNHLGLWERLKDRRLQDDTGDGAIALVADGRASLGLVLRSEALRSKQVKTVGAIPVSSHKRIAYTAMLVDRDDPLARRAYQSLTTPETLRVLRRHGFLEE